ncbi:macro domain-containing protein [Micrococcales bacterium 31B]|nr:macro domain-containing protein [Micrococcales bacterium 31B]
MLCVRPPRAIPTPVRTALDALLATEAAARPVTGASGLPTLAAEPGSDALAARWPGLPLDRVALWRGDLTTLAADAIVNAANSQMLGCFSPAHACIDNAIHAVAGPGLRLECNEHMRRQGHLEPTGTATLTGGYHLPARHVIHTVGPIVHRWPDPDAPALLASCYESILDVAETAGLDSVGLCSISTGVFGYPKPEAARVALAALTDWFSRHPTSRMRIVVSLFADVDEAAYRAALTQGGAS